MAYGLCENGHRRRQFLKLAGVGGAAIGFGIGSGGEAQAAHRRNSPSPCPDPKRAWSAGVEGQRRADLGDGTFLNPVLSGDRPDPTILKDGEDYYLTYSSVEYYPGIVIWHSRDLVNWTPVGPALTKYIGAVWALDLIKHDGRYYIYIPAVGLEKGPDGVKPKRGLPPFTVYVIHADSIQGPWSDPIDLKINGFDPGHVVGEDGKRYLFINDGRRIQLADDGLSTVGKLEKVYNGWTYPADWVVEGFALEGPKILKKDGWFYMFTAEGGTAGPPTSHMVICARSRSVNGPWENCPHNPIVRTAKFGEPWWSRGHATAVQGPRGDWWLVYHGYENGFRTLGRQLLLDPIEWDEGGWPVAKGGDLAKPMPKPSRERRRAAALQPLSDDFTQSRLGIYLAFFSPQDGYLERARFGPDGLVLEAQGKIAGDSSPLAFIAGDWRYEVTVEASIEGGAEAGVLLFYGPPDHYCGLGFKRERGAYYRDGNRASDPPPQAIGEKFHLRLVNDRDVVSLYYSGNGTDWTLHASVDVAAYHHNVAGGFMSLRPALYAAGQGSARFRNLRYRALT